MKKNKRNAEEQLIDNIIENDNEYLNPKIKPRKKLSRIFGILFLSLLITTIGLGIYVFVAMRNIAKDPGKHIPAIAVKDHPTAWADVDGNSVDASGLRYNDNLRTVLLIGADTNVQRDAKNKGFNGDVMMILSIDVVTNKTYMISVPRDTLAEINKLNSKGQVTGTRTTKINAAFSEGHGMKKFSCENTVAAVSKLIDIPIVNYIGLNMDSVGPLADAVGGVPVTIDADFSHYGMPKGSQQLLTGSKALTYIRERHLPGTGGSDVERTKRQLNFIKAYSKKLKELNPLTVLAKNYSIMQKNTHTNLNYEQLYAIAQYLKSADFDNATKLSLPGHGDGNGNWVVKKSDINQIRNDFFFIKK